MNKKELIQFLRSNEIWAKRSMGQNFLVDEDALKKIVQAAELKPTDLVVEIGPGLGVLTEELSKLAGRILAIEKDDKFAKGLKVQFSNSNVEILHQDVLEFDSTDLNEYKLVANIPYNITSLIIRKFLEAKNKPQLIVLLVQKEVAQRIVAKPGEMSLLAVSVQFYADVEIVDFVPADSFYPAPKVDSAIIKITPKSRWQNINEKNFFRLVKFGFAAKRKTLENNLAAGMHQPKEIIADIIKKAGLSPKARAEELKISNWSGLYKIIEEGFKDGEEGTRRNP